VLINYYLDISSNPRAVRRLHTACERAKRTLLLPPKHPSKSTRTLCLRVTTSIPPSFVLVLKSCARTCSVVLSTPLRKFFVIPRSTSCKFFLLLSFYTTTCRYKTKKGCFKSNLNKFDESRGLGQAKPEPSREWRLWPGLTFDKAKAASGQAKAGAFRPSRAVHSTREDLSEPKGWIEWK
jgi:hypothetical protein